MREQSPEKFFGRFINQFWYGIMGWNEIWTPHCTNLKRFVSLVVDGVAIDLPEDTEGLILCNIPSFGGGIKLWDITHDSFSPVQDSSVGLDLNAIPDEISEQRSGGRTTRRKSIRKRFGNASDSNRGEHNCLE